MRTNSSSETPTRAVLRRELLARDQAVHHLRDQLQTVNSRAFQTIEAQQYNFAVTARRHAEQSRRIELAEVNRVEADMQNDHESRIQTLVQQEQNSHDQLMRLQHDVAASQGQMLASDTTLRNQQVVVNEIEHEANDHVSKLEAEVRDAAHEASILQRERDV